MAKTNKGGRPKKEFDLKQVEIFGKFRATYETMADYFGCSEQTIRRNIQDENSEFCKVYKKAFSNSKLKLSEAQFQYALKGNASLLIWLGKQYLGQTDKQETENTKPQKPIEIKIIETNT